MTSATDDVGSNQRWWEGYLVRYFLGFIIGCMCVIILFNRANPSIAESLRESILPSTNAVKSGSQAVDGNTVKEKGDDIPLAPFGILVAFTGIAYCYICSTPITVLHSTRMMNTWFRRYSRTFWMSWAMAQLIYLIKILLGVSGWYDGAILFLIIVTWSHSAHLSSRSTTPIPTHGRLSGARFASSTSMFLAVIFPVTLLVEYFTVLKAPFFLFALPAVWIMLGQYWTIIRLLEDQSKTFFEFYKRISKARQRGNSRDIRDSYTHLREHGNAIFVVMIELAILATLICIADVLDQLGPSSSRMSDYYSSLLIIIGIWLAPTVFVWGLANRLENEFSEKPDEFLEP